MQAVCSTALEASRVLHAGRCTLLHLSGFNNKNATQYLQLHDAASVPPNAVAEQFTVDFTGLTAADLADKKITAADSTGPVYFWFDLDGGGADPGGTGTPIEVDLTTGMTAAQQADAFAAAADATAGFTSTAASGVATVVNATTGARTNAADVDSGAIVTTTVAGISGAVPLAVICVETAKPFDFALPACGYPFANGAVIVNSSTLATLTIGSADCFFTALFT